MTLIGHPASLWLTTASSTTSYLDRIDETEAEMMRIVRLNPRANLDPAAFPLAALSKLAAMKSAQGPR